MASRFYTLLLTVAGAGALFSLGSMFGLGVLTAPPVDQHKEMTVAAKPVKVDKKAEQARREADSKLSPLYPTSPGLTKAELRAAEQASAAVKSEPPKTDEAKPPQQSATTGAPAASEPEPRDAAPAKTASVTASASASKPDDKPAPKQVANVSPAPVPPAASPASMQSSNRCDVSACAASYKSFRESDCTYQPFSGPRQLCVKPPAPEQQASKRPDRKSHAATLDRRDNLDRGDNDRDLKGAIAEVRKMTPGAENFDDDPYPPGRRVIMIERW